jgi:hypothetical protein
VAASLEGTDGRDVIGGTDRAEEISGLGGDDTLNGRDGRDAVRGGDGVDEVSCGGSADKAYGNAGDDYLSDAPDEDGDVLYGGSGRDNVQVRGLPAVKDGTYCGSGRDTAYVDKKGRRERLRDREAAVRYISGLELARGVEKRASPALVRPSGRYNCVQVIRLPGSTPGATRR